MATEARVQFDGEIESIRKVVCDGTAVQAIVSLRPVLRKEAGAGKGDGARGAAAIPEAMPQGLAALRRLRSVDMVVEDPDKIRYLEEQQAKKGDRMKVSGDLCIQYGRFACGECGTLDPGPRSIGCVRPLSMCVSA